MPLVLQLVNDESKTCRETISKCIMALLKRLSIHVLQSLREYALWWSTVEGREGQQLRRTSIQLFGIFIEARLDFMKRADRLEEVVTQSESRNG
jgi:U3 small nucleolar RNA-associated protein 20